MNCVFSGVPVPATVSSSPGLVCVSPSTQNEEEANFIGMALSYQTVGHSYRSHWNVILVQHRLVLQTWYHFTLIRSMQVWTVTWRLNSTRRIKLFQPTIHRALITERHLRLSMGITLDLALIICAILIV